MPMTDSRPRSVLHAVGALVVAVTLAVVLPLVLIEVASSRLGGPAPWAGVEPPWRWTFEGVRDTLGRPLGEPALIDLVLRIAISVVWVASLTVVVTIVVEVVHMRRHGGLPSPPVRGLGWSQRVARFVAGGLLVLASFSTAARAGASTAPLPPRSAVATVEQLSAVDGPASGGPARTMDHTASSAAASDSAESSAWRSYTVQPGDSVYGIAARVASSDVGSVPIIADRILDRNLGAVMSDGQRFTNAALIQPGWVLQIPGAVPPPARRVADGAATHVVQRGDTLSSIAEDHLGSPDRWPEIWDANAGAAFDGRTFDDPDLILPGWELEVPRAEGVDQPPVPTPPIVTPTVPADTTTPPIAATPTTSSVAAPSMPRSATVTSPTDSAGSVAPPAPRPSDGQEVDRHAPASPSPIGLGHAAMLSAGIVALVGVVRQRRLRAARPHARLPARAPDTVASERLLRSVDAHERLLRVDIAVRAVAGTLAEHDRGVLVVLAAPSGDVELVLSGRCELAAPWTGSDDRWTLPGTVAPETLASAARVSAMPCPALVQLGVTSDERDVFVDLEAVGVLGVVSQVERSDAVVAGIAATLGSSPFAEVANLIGVGIDEDAFVGHRHRHSCTSVEESLSLATDLVGVLPVVATSTFALRARMIGGEHWEPAIVVIGSSAEVELEQVAHLRPSQGIALVAASPAPGLEGASGACLVDEGGRWRLRIGDADSEGFELTPIGLVPDELMAVTDLLAAAGDEPLDADPHGGSIPASIDDDTIPDWSLLVRLLGPVDVVTSDEQPVRFERSKTRELIAWLSTHRERSTRTAARTAMWELDVRDATFANVVSEARRAMARAIAPPEGSEWLARTLTEQLPLHPNVRTDADVLEHRLATARRQERDDAVATLQPAVALIRGMPFEGTSYLWPDAEGLTSNLVLLATSAAAELAALHLENDDVEGVFWATGQGLRALAGHEELIALRMRAHARAGDMAGVRREWESYERVIHADPWSDGEPAPKLVELRRELLSSP